MINFKKAFMFISSFGIPLVTTASLISCGWTISPNKDGKIVDDKWDDIKFNIPVMPGWKDLNIVGTNEKEWKRLKQIYDQEIKDGHKQLDEMDQGLKENDDLTEFDQMVGGLTKTMLLWYKQINVEIDLNLWLINENLTINKMLVLNNKLVLIKAKEKLEFITKSKDGFYNQWVDQFTKWMQFMDNHPNMKKHKKDWNKDKANWNIVYKHLETKNNEFKKIIQAIDKNIEQLKN